MSWFGLAGAGLGAVSSAIGAGLSYAGQRDSIAAQKEIAEQNLQFQREALAQNQKNQEITWNREDTATQRAAADLEAAGLSKTLAAGNAASTSAPMRVEALHNNYKPESKLEKMGQMMQSMSSIGQALYGLEQAEANVNKTKAETNQINAVTDSTTQQTSFFKNTLETRKADLYQQFKNHEISYSKMKKEIEKVDSELDWLKTRPMSEYGRALWDAEHFSKDYFNVDLKDLVNDPKKFFNGVTDNPSVAPLFGPGYVLYKYLKK